MELWDAYYRDGSCSGKVLVRGEAIPVGLYHIVSDTVVRHVDGSFLFMLRDLKKEMYAGLYEAGAGGSALRGESPEQAAVRELREETGIEAKELSLLTTYINDERGAIHYIYFCVTDCPKDSVVLQKGETIGYKWIPGEDFADMLSSEQCIPVQRERLLAHIEKIL